MNLIRRFFLRLVCFFRPGRAEAELSREINAHLQLLEDKFVAGGMSPEEARLAAQRAFGGVEQTKELQRDARAFRWLSGCTMDLTLGVRMLVKYPGLTLVGSLAMAFAIAAGTATFEVIKRVTAPELGLPGGNRLVGLKFQDRAEGAERPAYAYDFMNWRENLSSVQDVGAYRLLKRNLAAHGSYGEPVTATQISAAAFRVARVSAFLGRTLVEADETPTAAPVVVLGYDLWQTRFAGDRAILGREVKVGDSHATVVGVMPEGFRFPVDDQLWIPLRPTELAREPGREALRVFGRLAPGVTLPEAQAEASTLAARTAAAWPETYAHLTPQVLPYAESVIAIPAQGRAGIYALYLLAALFLVVVCGNVALLIFARAATREKELLVRTALGATRGRIVGMLFLEALVLAIIAAAMGLAAAGVLLRGAAEMMSAGPDRWPFWLDGGLSATTVLYAGLLALAAAAIAGVVPGLKVMGKGLWDRMRQSSAGGGGLRMGGVWTGVIIAQVAATILFTALAF
ncbi:MAG: ABC transporter permease, partial [Verrucomicrobiota bacterium]